MPVKKRTKLVRPERALLPIGRSTTSGSSTAITGSNQPGFGRSESGASSSKHWVAKASAREMAKHLREEFLFDRVKVLSELPGGIGYTFRARLSTDWYLVDVKADLDFDVRLASQKQSELFDKQTGKGHKAQKTV